MGVETAAVYIIGAAASLVIGGLARQDKKNVGPKKVEDDAVTLAAPGDRSALVLGTDEIGPVYAWWGNDSIQIETANDAGKGLGAAAGGQETQIFYEEAVHVVGTGRMRALRRIKQSGDIIWEGYITPVNSPDGSEITLDNAEGTFRIFYGGPNQLADEWAADEGRIGVLSQWPQMPHVDWISKRLGQTKNWPEITYEAEFEPDGSAFGLSPLEAWIEGTPVLDEGALPVGVISAELNAVVVIGDPKQTILSGTTIVLLNAPGFADEAELTVASVTLVTPAEIGLITSGSCAGIEAAKWAPDEVLAVLAVDQAILPEQEFQATPFCTGNNKKYDSSGIEIQAFREGANSGANPAHMMAQLIAGPYPTGLGRPVDMYDTASFKSASALFVQEQFRGSIRIQDGEDVDSALNAILRDTGSFLVQNSSSGLLELIVVRPGRLKKLRIPKEAFQGRLPEIEQVISPELRPPSQSYGFRNRRAEYASQSVTVSADGVAEFNRGGAQVDTVRATVDPDTAQDVAVRRELENFGEIRVGRLSGGFAARAIRPGVEIELEGQTTVFISLGSRVRTDETGAELELVTASLLAQPIALRPLQDGDPVDPAGFLEADQVALWQVPSELKKLLPPVEIALLWTRASALSTQALVWLSASGVSYQIQVATPFFATGGVLLEDFVPPAGAVSGDIVSQGPICRVSGVDIDLVQDYSNDDPTWQAGVQLGIINGEVWFLAGISLQPGGLFRILALKLGNYGTAPQTHPAGSEIYIFAADSFTSFANPALLSAGSTAFCKPQVIGSGLAEPLGDIEAIEIVVEDPA